MYISNAKISSTMLGVEDHGIMTFSLMMDMGGTGQGFGGYALDGKSGTIGHAKSITAIRKILETVGVDKWENLKGQLCRIKKDSEWNGPIKSIGHIIEDRWFSLEDHFAS
jgi:hypothetical protein